MKKSDLLLSRIRNGGSMTGYEKLNLIWLLSVPSILAQITSVMMFFIDQAMVGSLGAESAAAVGLVESTTWLFGSFSSAVAMGFSVQVAHFIGANDFRKARDVFRHGLIAALLFSLIVSMVGIAVSWRLPYWLGGGADIADDASAYFRIFAFIIPFFQLNILCSAMLKASGNMRIPSISSITMCVLDVVFNFLLIYPSRTVEILGSQIWIPGAGWGVVGAATGTALAVVITSLILSWVAIFRSTMLSLRIDKERFRFMWDYIRKALSIGAPMAVQAFLMSSAQIVSTMIVAPLGNIAIAANTFAITAESLCYMPGYGMGEAATTLVGQSIGAQRFDLTRSFARMTVFSGMIVMALMGVVMYFTSYDLMSLMTPVEEIRALGAGCLRIEAFAEPFFAASIITYQVCVGAGDTLKPAAINLLSMWIVRLSLAALLAQEYGLRGVWFAMAVELTFRGILFLIRLFNFRKLQLS